MLPMIHALFGWCHGNVGKGKGKQFGVLNFENKKLSTYGP